MEMATRSIGAKEAQVAALRAANASGKKPAADGGALSKLAAKLSGAPCRIDHSAPGAIPVSLCRQCTPTPLKPAQAKNPTAPTPPVQAPADKPAPAQPAAPAPSAPVTAKGGKAAPKGKGKPASKAKAVKAKPGKAPAPSKPAKPSGADGGKPEKAEPRSKHLLRGKDQPRGAFNAVATDRAIDMALRKDGVTTAELKKENGLRWNNKRSARFFRTIPTALCGMKVTTKREGQETRFTCKAA